MFLWAVEKLQQHLPEVYVSSDDDAILLLAEAVGAKPIRRSSNLGGDVPNITVYQHALGFMDADGIVAVQSCSPTVDDKLIKTARDLLLMGYQEVMTSKPIVSSADYHNQFHPIYGSIWALSRERLQNYDSPYHPNPEVLLVDCSTDIHTETDFMKAHDD